MILNNACNYKSNLNYLLSFGHEQLEVIWSAENFGRTPARNRCGHTYIDILHAFLELSAGLEINRFLDQHIDATQSLCDQFLDIDTVRRGTGRCGAREFASIKKYILSDM